MRPSKQTSSSFSSWCCVRCLVRPSSSFEQRCCCCCIARASSRFGLACSSAPAPTRTHRARALVARVKRPYRLLANADTHEHEHEHEHVKHATSIQRTSARERERAARGSVSKDCTRAGARRTARVEAHAARGRDFVARSARAPRVSAVHSGVRTSTSVSAWSVADCWPPRCACEDECAVARGGRGNRDLWCLCW